MIILIGVYVFGVMINISFFVWMVKGGDIFVQTCKRPFIFYALIFLAILGGFLTWVVYYILYRLHRDDII